MESRPGFRFVPCDEDLVTYLYEKVYGGGEARSDRVLLGECDMYGDKEPWQIWDENGGSNIKAGEDLYLFTKLKNVSFNGSNCKRRVGSGTWAGAYGVDVAGGLAKKKHFSYENKGCSEHHGEWIMHEYSLVDGSAEYVLCRLRRKVSKNIKKTKTKLMSSTIQTKNIPRVNDQDNHQEIMIMKQRIGVESHQDPITIHQTHLNHVEDQQYNLSINTNNIENITHYSTPNFCDHFGEFFDSVSDGQSKCVDFGHGGVLELDDDVIDYGFMFDCDEQALKEIEEYFSNAAVNDAKSSSSTTYHQNHHVEVVDDDDDNHGINDVAKSSSSSNTAGQVLGKNEELEKTLPPVNYSPLDMLREEEVMNGMAIDIDHQANNNHGTAGADDLSQLADVDYGTKVEDVDAEHQANNNHGTAGADDLSQLDVDYGTKGEDDDVEEYLRGKKITCGADERCSSSL